jgi:tellurite resistance protein TerC
MGRMMFSLNAAKRLVRIVFGFTLLGLGAAMLVLPGPGWVTIALGLAVLATEYVWARRLLDRLKKTASDVKSRVTGRGPGQVSS